MTKELVKEASGGHETAALKVPEVLAIIADRRKERCDRKYGKPNGHAQKAVTVQRGKIVGTRNTSVCSENVNSVFFYWLFSIHSYKISQGSYAWVHTDICIVKE